MKKIVRLAVFVLTAIAGIAALSSPTAVHAEGSAPVALCPPHTICD